jgi:outer membrane receptor protein involved in Fe transport
MVPPNDFGIIHGNPEIRAEKTVQYEMGVWLELMPRMGLEVSVYYKDIYDLLSAVVYTTYNQIKYGVYSNKDYGNAKGFELKYDYATGPFGFYLNYTLQYTRGNADNPTSTYSREGQSLDPVPYLVPLNWDQRHTANLSVVYTKQNFGLTLTGYMNSGQPYTFTPVSVSPLAKQTLYPNNSTRPTTYTVDLRGHYDFNIGQTNSLRLFLSIYNLLDRKNELFVNSTTGRAYTAIIYPINIATFRSNFNDVYDSVQNPYMYAPPREIKIGLGYLF